MRLRATIAATAAVLSLAVPAAATTPRLTLMEGRPTLYALDDLDRAAADTHAQLAQLGAALRAQGREVHVPTVEELRESFQRLVTLDGANDAPPLDPLELLDESQDEDESYPFDGISALSSCGSSMTGHGKKIRFIPVYRYVYLTGTHWCGDGVLVCVTVAGVPSPKKVIWGLGLSSGWSSCHNETDRSSYTTKPTAAVGANALVTRLGEAYGVMVVPFAKVIG